MLLWNKLKNTTQKIVGNHGPEITTCVKIVSSALLPGGSTLVEAIGALCDYTNEKSRTIEEEEVRTQLETLGTDQTHLMTVIDHLADQFRPILEQMVISAQYVPEEALEKMINTAILQDANLMEIRQQIRTIQPKLESIQQQNEIMLRQQSLQGDMLEQVRDQIEAVMVFDSLQAEGLIGQDARDFVIYDNRFTLYLNQGDLEAAEQALAHMKSLSPHGKAKVCEMALKATRKDFEGAEQIAQTLSSEVRQNTSVQRATRSLNHLTQAHQSLRDRGEAREFEQVSTQSSRLYLQRGQRIGDRGWVLTSILGRGGMGEVWRAKNSRHQEGAIKIMKLDLSQDQDFVLAFQAEIDALYKVSHPNVIDILDWGEDRVSGAWYFVMPYLGGQSLRSKLNRAPMQEQEIRDLIFALGEGLVACHTQGIIHRDIKPENIMFDDKKPILIDFGIAYQPRKSTHKRVKSSTEGYAPPEQLKGQMIGPQADLYALGMTAIECFGGERFVSKPLRKILKKITDSWVSERGTAQELVDYLQSNTQKQLESYLNRTITPISNHDYRSIFQQACDGDADAQFICGLCSINPMYGQNKSVVKAREWLKKSALSGHAWAALELGKLYLYESDCLDHDLAKIYFGEAQQHLLDQVHDNNQHAMFALSVIYSEGWGVNKNHNKAIEWANKGAENDHLLSMMRLASYFNGHIDGVEADLIQSEKWFMKSIDQWKYLASAQHTYYIHHLGLLHECGIGTFNKNIAKAVKHYRCAAEQGYAQAQYALGNCYYSGNGVEQSYETAIEWYRHAAKQGYARAQYSLALCYNHAKGTEQDYVKAAKWYRLAAEQDYERAQHGLGYCFSNGKGVEQDYEQAVKWYKRSAKQGYHQAQHSLGYCYEIGKGVGQNHKQAVKWYRSAAKQGYDLSQFNLGLCYEYGKGVEKNKRTANQWYKLAAEQEYEPAQKKLAATNLS